MLDMTSQQR